MKTVTSTVLIALCASVAFAQDQRTESQTLRDRVSAQVDRLSVSVDERNAELIENLRAKYGFDVACDGGFLGFWNAVSKDNCFRGLNSLDRALANVPVNVSREELNSVTIELAKPDNWMEITSKGEMKVPYTWHPERMQAFINQQVTKIFRSSVEDIVARNEELVKDLKDSYHYTVVADKNLTPVEFYDGLQKLRIAAKESYGTAKVSAEEYQNFGFDTVVLSKEMEDLYEDQGQLRTKVDINANPGDMFLHLISRVERPEGKYAKYIPFKAAPYSRAKIDEIRRDQARVAELNAWANEAFQGRQVECILDKSAARSITITECRKGLEKLQQAFVKHGQPAQLVGDSRIVIGDTVMNRRFENKETGTLFVGYENSVDSMYNAVTARRQ